MKIKPFKYAGTPEQITKLVAWLKGKGVEEEDCSKIGQPPYTCIFCEGATYQLCSHMKTYKRDLYSTLPPEYELEIFGTTKGITGKPESEWFLNEGNNPFQENFNREIQLTLRSGEEVDGKANYGWDWIMRDSTSDIIRWRYAEKSDEEYFVQPETPDKASKFAVKLDLPNGRQPIKPSVRVVNYTNSTEYQDEEINVSDYEKEVSSTDYLKPIIDFYSGKEPVRNKYMREIKPGVWVDCYDVIRAFNVTDGALQHLLKKALAVGQRGHKDAAEDYADIVASAKRAEEIFNEWDQK